MIDSHLREQMRRAVTQALELGHKLGKQGTSLNSGLGRQGSPYVQAFSYAEQTLVPAIEAQLEARTAPGALPSDRPSGSGIASRRLRQARVNTWVQATFGRSQAGELPERALRVVEEAIELAQALGVPEGQAHRMVCRVFDRPAGEPGRELGGLGVTLLACAAALGMQADQEEDIEVERVLAIPAEEMRARHAAKIGAGVALPAGDAA